MSGWHGTPGDALVAETRSALIIASDSYTDPGLRQLRAPAVDAQALAEVLQDPEIGQFEVRTLLNEPAHMVNLAIEDFFADRRPGDLLLVHFSGHGIKDQDGQLYFAAPNTVLGRLGATAVAAEFVNRQMYRSRSRRVVLLLDCCYAGAFERGLVARAGMEIGIEHQFGGRGRAVITASSAMEYAFEAGELADAREAPPSVFTSAVVEGLESGEADRNQDGLVGLDELYEYVYDKVRAATPNQTPGKWMFGIEGVLYIARCRRAATMPAPLPPELLQAINSPLDTVRAGAIHELAKMVGLQLEQKHQVLGLQLEQRYEAEGTDPRLLLARRLRALREERWPGIRVTQPQLARALGGSNPLSVPLVSSWESLTHPVPPPLPRLIAYAALFATRRSFTGPEPRVIRREDMSPEERAAMDELRTELTGLRNRALAARQSLGAPGRESPKVSARARVASQSLSSGPWYFPDGGTITIVSAQLPAEMLTRIPYTDVTDPDYIELFTYSDLDSLFMTYAHLRAVNPFSQVNYFRSGLLPAESFATHLVSLGGADWNEVTASLLSRFGLPVRQVVNWGEEGGVFFEVDDDAGKIQYRPVLGEADGRVVLLEDVALFARAVNPYNQTRAATICIGMYGRGTYGAVRALTDPEFLEPNIRYLESRFGNSRSYCLIFRVKIVNNKTLTPDWTDDHTRLFEWPGPVAEGSN